MKLKLCIESQRRPYIYMNWWIPLNIMHFCQNPLRITIEQENELDQKTRTKESASLRYQWRSFNQRRPKDQKTKKTNVKIFTKIKRFCSVNNSPWQILHSENNEDRTRIKQLIRNQKTKNQETRSACLHALYIHNSNKKRKIEIEIAYQNYTFITTHDGA